MKVGKKRFCCINIYLIIQRLEFNKTIQYKQRNNNKNKNKNKNKMEIEKK